MLICVNACMCVCVVSVDAVAKGIRNRDYIVWTIHQRTERKIVLRNVSSLPKFLRNNTVPHDKSSDGV